VLLQIQYTEVTSSLSQPTKTKQLAKENKSATKEYISMDLVVIKKLGIIK
jgi:hypothetical protein